MITQKVYVLLRKNFMKRIIAFSFGKRRNGSRRHKDFADAIEKVVYNISDLRDSNLSKQTDKKFMTLLKRLMKMSKIKGQKGLFIFSDPAGAKACLALAKSFKQKTLLIISDRKFLQRIQYYG